MSRGDLSKRIDKKNRTFIVTQIRSNIMKSCAFQMLVVSLFIGQRSGYLGSILSYVTKKMRSLIFPVVPGECFPYCLPKVLA